MSPTKTPIGLSIEIAINLLLILLIVAWCLKILLPFISFIMWGAVIAISLYTPFCGLRARIGNKLAVTLFTLSGLALVLIPAWLFAGSVFETTQQFANAVETGTFTVPAPNEAVEQWPIIGDKLYAAWAAAATNFEGFLTTYHEQLRSLSSLGMSKAKDLGLTVVLFILATVIAAAMLAHEGSIAKGMQRLFARLLGQEEGADMMKLVTGTVRSVTMGVLGVAFIQALLGGLGFVAAGVPAAGVLALVVLIMAIAQLPVLLLMIPVIIYVFSVQSTTVAIIFAIWSTIVAVGDAGLKPLFLGRGVPVPTLVILLGAIGGMITSGIIGLFVGAVVLALGYKLFVQWLKMGEAPVEDATEETAGQS